MAEIDLDWGWLVALPCYQLGRRNNLRERRVEILDVVGDLPAATFKVVIPHHRRLALSSLLELDAPLSPHALAVPIPFALPTRALLFYLRHLWVIAGKVILHVIDAPRSARLLPRRTGVLPQRPLAVTLDWRLLFCRLVIGRLIFDFQAFLLGEEVLLRGFRVPEAVTLAVLRGDCDFFPGEASRHRSWLKFTILFITTNGYLLE